METEPFFWMLNHTYRDKGVRDKTKGYPPEDEFASKVSIDRKQNWGIKNTGGIRSLARGLNGARIGGIPAAVFIISNKSQAFFHNPWDDSLDQRSSIIQYHGDAKYRLDRDAESWPGNKLLLGIYDEILKGNLQSVPPILYFTKEKSGYVIFRGLCTLKEVKKYCFEDMGYQVLNYRYTLIILDTDKINPEWLVRRATDGPDVDESIAPEVWTQYVRLGVPHQRTLQQDDNLTSKDQPA